MKDLIKEFGVESNTPLKERKKLWLQRQLEMFEIPKQQRRGLQKNIRIILYRHLRKLLIARKFTSEDPSYKT